MTLLLPLGLLGLLSLAVLILIYVIRPNYQNKLVSTTYVWKLSMKYRKKRLPISKLRNLLILLCQLILLATLAMMMAQPAVPILTGTSENEKIAVLDASASMQIRSGNSTRYSRAIEQIKELADDTLSKEDGVLSVIVAGSDAYLAATRLTSSDKDIAAGILDELNAQGCGYGSADIDGAAELAEQLLQINSRSEVIYYTATTHQGSGSFKVVDVGDADDWNAAVLGVDAVMLEATNTYCFDVSVGCFGDIQNANVKAPVNVTLQLVNPNMQKDEQTGQKVPTGTFTCTKTFYPDGENAYTVHFSNSTDKTAGGDGEDADDPEQQGTHSAPPYGTNGNDFNGLGGIYSFERVEVTISSGDSFTDDNQFVLYGTTPSLRVQYATSGTTAFYSGAIRYARNEFFKETWDIEFVEVSPDKAATSGFDLYIFEGTAPDKMPTDGVVLLSNPDKAPEGSGFEISSSPTMVDFDTPLDVINSSPLTQYMTPQNINAGSYRTVTKNDGSYQDILSCDGVPVLLARNDADVKAVLLTIDLNYSTFAVSPAFAMFIYNIFNYYLPPTLSQNDYEVGETVTVNARGEDLSVRLPDNSSINAFESLPAQLTATIQGTYSVSQTGLDGSPLELEQFFVHVPNEESNITRMADALPELYAELTQDEGYDHLIMWFAIAAIVLFAAEWLLHSRENL